jgi:hypothetical protein
MQGSAVIRLIALALVTLAASNSANDAAASPLRLPGHALLINRPGLRVFGPPLHASVRCPDLLPLPAGEVATVKRAVQLAMPPFERGELNADRRAAPTGLRGRAVSSQLCCFRT